MKIIDMIFTLAAGLSIVVCAAVIGFFVFPFIVGSWLLQFSGWRITGTTQKIKPYFSDMKGGAG